MWYPRIKAKYRLKHGGLILLKSKKILNHFFSTKCLLCQNSLSQNETTVCHHCVVALPKIKNACIQCNTPVSNHSSSPLSNNTQTQYLQLCGVCLSNQRYWRRCRSAFLYQEPVTSLIHQFKYNNHSELTPFFANILIKSVISNIQELPDILTHVPSHSRKFAKRGYNQSFWLARSVSKAIGIPHLSLFHKTVNTKLQATLNSKKRKNSLKNTFVLNEAHRQEISGMRIAIIDDVVTTGSTCSELAKIAKKAKPSYIDVWCVARTWYYQD